MQLYAYKYLNENKIYFSSDLGSLNDLEHRGKIELVPWRNVWINKVA